MSQVVASKCSLPRDSRLRRGLGGILGGGLGSGPLSAVEYPYN